MADLMAACEKSGELRRIKPRYPPEVLERLRAIREDLEAPSAEHLPARELDILMRDLNALIKMVEGDYPRDDEEIKIGSAVYERVIDLDATLKALRRHIVESDDYREFLERLKRIDGVLPSEDYDFNNLFRHIGKDNPTEKIYRRLRESAEEFRSRRYEECLGKTGKLNEALIENLKEYTWVAFNCRVESLGDCRDALLKATAGSDSRSRLDWFVMCLLEVTRFLRNLSIHEDNKRNIPSWMHERQEWLRQESATARLILLCELHAALELKHLWQNEAPSSSRETEADASQVKSTDSA